MTFRSANFPLPPLLLRSPHVPKLLAMLLKSIIDDHWEAKRRAWFFSKRAMASSDFKKDCLRVSTFSHSECQIDLTLPKTFFISHREPFCWRFTLFDRKLISIALFFLSRPCDLMTEIIFPRFSSLCVHLFSLCLHLTLCHAQRPAVKTSLHASVLICRAQTSVLVNALTVLSWSITGFQFVTYQDRFLVAKVGYFHIQSNIYRRGNMFILKCFKMSRDWLANVEAPNPIKHKYVLKSL